VTTIATDGRSMAADGQSSLDGGQIICTTKKKIYRLSDGSLLGGAGTTWELDKAVEWLNGDQQAPAPKLKDFAGLKLTPDGRAFYCTEPLQFSQIDVPAAVGSGQELAVGAMLAGASPKQAIEVAIKRDPHSGGRILVVRR
jgi:ATP-dependent protease HslVU (ClpYQ) peptidase subunit